MLTMQQSNLAVYLFQRALLGGDETTRPLLHKRDLLQKEKGFQRHPILIATGKEIDSQQAESSHDRKQHSHESIYRIQGYIEEDGKEPKPEMRKDVHHHIQDDGGSGFADTDVWSQFHNPVWLATHQSAGRGIVNGETCDG